jgi:hypothetical protein
MSLIDDDDLKFAVFVKIVGKDLGHLGAVVNQ